MSQNLNETDCSTLAAKNNELLVITVSSMATEKKLFMFSKMKHTFINGPKKEPTPNNLIGLQIWSRNRVHFVN